MGPFGAASAQHQFERKTALVQQSAKNPPQLRSNNLGQLNKGKILIMKNYQKYPEDQTHHAHLNPIKFFPPEICECM